MYDPYAHLEYMNVRMKYGGRRMEQSGVYYDEDRTIVLRSGMSPRLERCVLAHECCHAEHRDVSTWDDDIFDWQELRADRTAAFRLITCTGYRAVAHLPKPLQCDKLGVVPRVLNLYAKMHEERQCLTNGLHVPAWAAVA